MNKNIIPKRQKTLRNSQELVDENLIPADQQRVIEKVNSVFSIAIPPTLVRLINSTNNDAIKRQFIPSPKETEVLPEEMSDPIGDVSHTPVKGITHRYFDRLLLKPVHLCPVYCRFCFRREFVGKGHESLRANELDDALNYIANHEEVWEVIISGGDPLILSDSKLNRIMQSLHKIPHIEIIRIHTRYPVAEPERITEKMVKGLLGQSAIYIVLHCNHPDELTEETLAACSKFTDNGIVVLSQTVLLKGVNDEAEILEKLFRKLVKNRIKPYYLHHLDLAQGTNHFRVSIKRGQELMKQIRGRLSGLCQPQYVIDIPGGYGKVPIGPDYVEETADSEYIIEDIHNQKHFYKDLQK
ncbi:MAG: lysine-2,3-aminomutase-like protein [Tatlockia sp.]|jgi:lysine 2,3-aminomutase|nr:lysine-2,3-aminomutase-like protein [Tatlockia sp.]